MERDKFLLSANKVDMVDGEFISATKAEKRKHWLLYNWMRIMMIIIVFILIVTTVVAIVLRVKPDYTIALATGYIVPDVMVRELRNTIEIYADDRNGDGRVRIDIAGYVFPTDANGEITDLGAFESSALKLSRDFATGHSMIFIYDESGYIQMVDMLEGVFGTVDVPYASISEFKAFDVLRGTKVETDFREIVDVDLFLSELRISMRDKNNIQEKPDIIEYYNASKVLFQNIKEGVITGE